MKGWFWFLDSIQTPVSEIPHLGLRKSPHAEQYCCPKCGTVWAGFVPEKDERVVYMFRHRKCAACGGGSLRIFGDYPLDFLPQEALLQELNIILNHREKYDALNWN